MPYEIKAIVDVTGTHCVKSDGEDCQFIQHFSDSDDGPFKECGLFTQNVDDTSKHIVAFSRGLRCKACLEAEAKFKKEGLQELG
jgi:hypothetical protein